MLTYYPRLCWEVGVSETWLTCYSWLLVCVPEQIWFTLANQSVRCLISCSWPCNSSQPARFLVPAHFHEEAHAMLNPLGKPTPWTWRRSLSKVWRSITCLWLPSATPVLHEKDTALSPPPSPYSSGSFKAGVAFMESPSPQAHGNLQSSGAIVAQGCTWDLWIPEHMDFPPRQWLELAIDTLFTQNVWIYIKIICCI